MVAFLCLHTWVLLITLMLSALETISLLTEASHRLSVLNFDCCIMLSFNYSSASHVIEVSWETAYSPWEGNQLTVDRSKICTEFKLTEGRMGDELVTGEEFI